MAYDNIIASIDIGTSKVSVLVCNVVSATNMTILGMGTSILKGIHDGLIKDQAMVFNALQNALKRAQIAADIRVSNVIVNVPNGQSTLTIQTGIVQNSGRRKAELNDMKAAMQKSTYCINKRNQSILHLFPIDTRINGASTTIKQFGEYAFDSMEVDTGIILCDTDNVTTVVDMIRKLGLTVRGIISDYLSIGAVVLPERVYDATLVIDFGAQLTNILMYQGRQLMLAQTISTGGAHITESIASCLKCSVSEAERIKVLHGQLIKSDQDLSKMISIQTHDGERHAKASLVTTVIESSMNQLAQCIKKYLRQFDQFSSIISTGSGANMRGLDAWLESRFSVPVNTNTQQTYDYFNINTNYVIAMGQIIYGAQIGLFRGQSSSFKKKVAELLKKR